MQTKEESDRVCQRIEFIRDSTTFSKIHQQFSHLENSPKIKDIHMSGPVVRNHISSKMTDEYNAARKTTYRSLSLVYRPVLPAQLHMHLQHRYRRSLLSLHCVQKQHEVRVRVALSPEPTGTEKTNTNEDTEPVQGDLLRDLPEC